jgi:hypothetical protein
MDELLIAQARKLGLYRHLPTKCDPHHIPLFVLMTKFALEAI